MSDYLNSRGNFETEKKFKILKNQKTKYFTPKKLIKPHQRITSLNNPYNGPQIILRFSTKKDNPPVRNHQKTQSMPISPQKLEEKIKKLECSMEKKNVFSTISTSTQSIDFLGDANSICVSHSSEDSITILKKQIKNVKNLTDCSGTHINTPKLKFDDDSFSEITHTNNDCKAKGFKLLEITDLALFNSIPVINLN